VTLAVPVAPPTSVAELRLVADEVITVITPRSFAGVGPFYRDFRQTLDDEVVAILARVARPD
jgi:predicted phosphoribosyltransferase